MRVEFIGDPNETDGMSRRELTLFGKTFRLGEQVDVSDLPGREQGLLAKHSHFRVIEAAAPAPVVEAAADPVDGEVTTSGKRGRRGAQAEE